MWLIKEGQSPVNTDHCKTIQKGVENNANEYQYVIRFYDAGVKWSFETENERDEEYKRVMAQITKPLYVISPRAME